MERIPLKVLAVAFFKSGNGTEPVRDWLKTLDQESRNRLGYDLKTLEFGWPRGMPLVRKLDIGLWEMRSHISERRIARLLFTVASGKLVLLHGFIKKTAKTRVEDLNLGRIRRDLVSGNFS